MSAVNAMTEYELSLWMVRGPLWPRRIELLLIQLTTVLAQVNGNKTTMADFDLFSQHSPNASEEAAHDIASLVGGSVFKLGLE